MTVTMRVLAPAMSSREPHPTTYRTQRERWQRLRRPAPVILRIPSSPESLFAAEFYQTLVDLHLHHTWFSFVPAMLGGHAATDAAAKAVMKVHTLSNPATSQCRDKIIAQGDNSYGKAIAALRSSLDDSDSALVSVGLLSLYEVLMRSQPQAYFWHAGGLSAMLLSRRKTGSTNELTRAIVYGDTHGTFQKPLTKGVASPFDDPFWFDLEPATFVETSDETKRLRKLGNQLLIRLPGLVARVRALRQRSVKGSFEQYFSQTAEVADQLLDLRDDRAETELLRRVAVRETRDPFDKAVVPYSFHHFASSYDKETLLIYWGGRLMAIRLCMELDRLSHQTISNPATAARPVSAHVEGVAGAPAVRAWDHKGMLDEQERITMSILMCWEDGLGQANPLCMVWGALIDKSTFRGKPAAIVRTWVWTRYQESLAGWPVKYTMRMMDEESEALAGGPLLWWLRDMVVPDGVEVDNG
ncbi:hypothetical protein BAUCODRAFT_121291 [Baudoinia panamericana UAMH 10762]|uniref:Uncharacterized protein n=1 Tax=Baudoinia panamericana (strain UAMH 10762) TaxID=717646 RepID=M2LUY1_BAUPA|nr:uncharacterized protein BAUCODRAFT_121291 [Baudoinia panamericana UAMH 10762]EMC98422.1 hypothetical protein BAUCODRAFT_121291 [Baudoinia panamericana UAMH 10762]